MLKSSLSDTRIANKQALRAITGVGLVLMVAGLHRLGDTCRCSCPLAITTVAPLK